MGSPIAFESRRQELVALNCPSTDQDVTDSFITLVDPTPAPPSSSSSSPREPCPLSSFKGLMVEYLTEGVIAVVLGDALYLHGAILPTNMGWVPPSDSSTEGSTVDNLLDWVAKINSFSRNEALAFANYASSYTTTQMDSQWAVVGGYDHPQPGSKLLQYGMGWLPGPENKVNPSAIYANYITNSGPTPSQTPAPSPDVSPRSASAPVPTTADVSEWLKQSGVRRVIVGHQPRGDCPLILSQEGGVQVYSIDTSYAVNAWWQEGQGSIDHEVRLKELSDEASTGQAEAQPSTKWAVHPLASAASKHPLLKHLTAPPPDSTRGSVVVEVFLSVPPQVLGGEEGETRDYTHSSLHLSGTLSDGSSYDFTLPPAPSEIRYVGKQTPQGWYVKAANVRSIGDAEGHEGEVGEVGEGGGGGGGGGKYLLTLYEGYTFKNRLVREEDMESEFR